MPDPSCVPSLYADLYPDLVEDEEAQTRLRAWVELQIVIADTLRIPFDDWNEFYLGYCFERPFDYSFVGDIDLGRIIQQFEDLKSSFERVKEAAFSDVKKVPLRANNNLGKLAPKVQDALGALLEGTLDEAIKLPPSDVAKLQKMFAGEKPLAKLKRPDFRKVELARESRNIVCRVAGGGELFRLSLVEFSAVLSKRIL